MQRSSNATHPTPTAATNATSRLIEALAHRASCVGPQLPQRVHRRRHTASARYDCHRQPERAPLERTRRVAFLFSSSQPAARPQRAPALACSTQMSQRLAQMARVECSASRPRMPGPAKPHATAISKRLAKGSPTRSESTASSSSRPDASSLIEGQQMAPPLRSHPPRRHRRSIRRRDPTVCDSDR